MFRKTAFVSGGHRHVEQANFCSSNRSVYLVTVVTSGSTRAMPRAGVYNVITSLSKIVIVNK